MIGLVDGNNFFVSCERVFNRRLVGRPVAVLSNNDGCCVSRSNEFKALGIPCGVGFAPTKTLAKNANHIGKKRPDGVFMLPDDPTDILASLPADEVWGVGRRLAVKLRAEQIFTAKDLRDASNDVIRSVGGVVLLRTANELRGKPCSDEAPKAQYACGRLQRLRSDIPFRRRRELHREDSHVPRTYRCDERNARCNPSRSACALPARNALPQDRRRVLRP